MRFFSLIFLCLLPFPSRAEDKILVTATRTESFPSDLPFSVGFLDGHEWDAKGGNAESALSSVAGLSITSSGGLGQNQMLSIRGAKAEHTMVLIDGVPVNDPLSPSRSFDFGQISVDEIDRIEVIKGPLSALYGSDAMGGLVQIFTRRDQGSRARIEGGSYGTLGARVATMGFRAGYSESKGFSSADSREGNAEPDGYRQWNLGGSKEFSANEHFLMRLNAQFQDNKVDTDRHGGRDGDSLNTFARHSQFLMREENIFLLSEKTELSLAGLFSSHNREDNTNGNDFYKAELWKAETILRRGELIGPHSFLLGAEIGEESGSSSQTTGGRRHLLNGGAFLQDEFKYSALHGVAGVRFDFHSQGEHAQTYRIGLGYWISPETFRMKGSIGTGFKAPSLYQTYSIYGSTTLRPEKNLSGDFGLELIGGEWGSELSIFANRFRDLIDFNLLTNRYFNQSRAQIYGLEWTFQQRLGFLRIVNALTLLRAVDPENGQPLLRRPRLSNNLELSYGRNQKNGGGINIRYVGIREDSHPTLLTREEMPAFLVLSANFFHSIGEGLRFTARAENLLDRHYQEISGYGVAELSGYAGLEAEF